LKTQQKAKKENTGNYFFYVEAVQAQFNNSSDTKQITANNVFTNKAHALKQLKVNCVYLPRYVSILLHYFSKNNWNNCPFHDAVRELMKA